MDAAVEKVLRAFEKRSEREWREMQKIDWSKMYYRRDEFLLSVGRATGQLLNLLAKEAQAKKIVEVGSSYGYSTVWLAEAARAIDGKVISLEIHEEKQKQARASIEKAGLSGFVDFRLGDARDLLAKLKSSVDFVLVDLWKDFYIPCFDLFYPRLRPGALVVADNMIYPEESQKYAAAYRKHVRSKKDIESVLLTVGSGIEVSRKKSKSD